MVARPLAFVRPRAPATLTVAPMPNPPVINDPQLTQRSLPSLEKIVGKNNVRIITLQTTAEDFSYYGAKTPALFFWVGVTPPERDANTAPFNHSPLFYMDEKALSIGVRAMLSVATDYLQTSSTAR